MRLISLAAALLLAGTVAAQATTEEYFDCGPLGDGSYLVSIDPAAPDQAEAIFTMGMDSGGGATGPATLLTAAPTGSGFRYVGPNMELRGQGNSAELRVEDMMLVCQIVSAGGSAFPVQARSWGGNVRVGPGMEYDRIGSFAEGEDLVIVGNTGVMMNGYPWFEVRDMEGAGGFHWGGIICWTTVPVDGVFQSCP